ncbi:nucleotidyl transferase AbiEii/AbiGii toxin family protein [Blautia sp. HCP3S3_G3]|uniref:nucleotidyl transferase AbiEii/AbiGii toxin family protein n=1 Tax=Blautia sp. HCP3S3_G3 TaxID=3438913 RepID=UPI003F88813B
MEKTRIIRSGKEVELLKYVPDYYLIAERVNRILDQLRVGISTWVTSDSFGDVVYPERVKMEFPVLLDMEVPQVYAYSIYSVIAEKFEAFVSLGLANGRYKDFYDIYVLADRYYLNGVELKNAIVETFTHRGTGFDDIAAFDDDFTKDETRQRRWRAFIKKKKALVKVEFEETMQLLKELLLPIVDSIHNDNSFEHTWSKETKSWM